MAVDVVVDGVMSLNHGELKSFGGELGKRLREEQSSEVIKSLTDSMPAKAKAKAIVNATADMTAEEKQDVAKGLIGPIPVETREKLWSIAVWSFAIVMVGAFVFLALGIFVERPTKPIASAEILVSMFTAAVGFFAGLFAPTPGKG